MTVDDPVRAWRHCAFVLHAHLVFVTEYRARVFTDEHLRYLEQVLRDVCEQFECELVEFDGGDNHVHLLVNFPPKVALSKLVNSLKGVSSRYLRRDLPEIRRRATVGTAPVYRTAEPPRLTRMTPGTLAAFGRSESESRFTPALKGGELRRVSVAG